MTAVGEGLVTVFLCGDVMTGRAIDQILPHPSDPRIYEEAVSDARTYITLAEEVNGPVPRPVNLSYIWGDALTELQEVGPNAAIVNLETSVTRTDKHWPKGINYRMNPANVGCLTAAGIDICVLANNHVLDYVHSGLVETLDTLHRAGLQTAGAGRTLEEAREPAVADVAGDSRVVVHGFGTRTSGIPPSWAATEDRPGIYLLLDLSESSAEALERRVQAVKRTGDVTIASVHWGSNWGYQVPASQIGFAHRLVDSGVDIVHGHSSHHPRPIEIYRRRVIFYGCGDFLNDYEGISGFELYRADLVLMYFATLDPASGDLIQLRMVPMQIRKMRLNRATAHDASWLATRLGRTSMPFGAWAEMAEDGDMFLRWE
jgi:poly-gamma-glutamate capsule biosynthesis protein CapA/YwtB (metallophosphatase superfamily)